MSPDDLLSRIREAIARGRCCPVVGAGVSIAANAPSWDKYLEEMANGLSIRPEQLAKLDPVDAASYLQAERSRLRLPPVRVKIKGPTRAHRALAAWGCSIYVTTNFDDGLEQALLAKNGAVDVHHNDTLDNLDLLGLADSVVVKLCSPSVTPKEGSITREDFASLLHHNTAALELLITLLRTYTVVFVGCSMRDPLISHALDHVFATPIGRNRHVAFLPDDVPEAYLSVLGNIGIDSVTFSGEKKTKHLADTLERCKPAASGEKRLVIFEPGTPTKTRQLFEALRSPALDLGRVAIVTESSAVMEAAQRLAALLIPSLTCDVLRVANVADTDSVVRALAGCTTSWNAIVSPFEFAIGSAASLAETWTEAHRPMRFHGVETARLSRDKRQFRQFLLRRSDLKKVRPIEFGIVPLYPDITTECLLDAIRDSARALMVSKVVVKPPDAAASRGVRPMDLAAPESARAAVGDLLNIIQSMPVSDETARCDVAELIIERRIESEEFSVESRCVGGSIEALTIHWKADIDADPSRFFERLFVTLPRDLPICRALLESNQELLQALGVKDGVFHAEYRADPDESAVYPLEIGLRPGGGMVSASVEASRGVNLFEAAIRCALDVHKTEPPHDHIVATGLVFAKRPGVLPPLGIVTSKSIQYLNHDDPSSIRQWLRQFLSQVPRREAHAALTSVIRRSNSLSRCIEDAFDAGGAEQVGLNVQLNQVELWAKPGSIVIEEEACYVAGLLITADPSLTPLAAVAEAVAAMQLCLNKFVCEPQDMLSVLRWRSARISRYPPWWEKLSTGGFRSDIDSWTFARAIEQHRVDNASILDLGCGSARPAIQAIKQAGTYYGVDICPSAVRDARGNLAQEIADTSRWRVEVQDIRDDEWIEALAGKRWDLVSANLPYLPAPPGAFDGDEAREVDGGLRGLAFLPCILRIAEHLRPAAVVVNTSSLCDLAGFDQQLLANGLGVHRVVATVAPLEGYALRVRDYMRASGFARVYGSVTDERQIIYAVELRKGGGVPFSLMIEQAEAVLRPDLNQIGTMAVGVVSWVI